jgi:hypothetical protein
MRFTASLTLGLVLACSVLPASAGNAAPKSSFDSVPARNAAPKSSSVPVRNAATKNYGALHYGTNTRQNAVINVFGALVKFFEALWQDYWIDNPAEEELLGEQKPGYEADMLVLAKMPGGGDVFPSAAAYLAFKQGLEKRSRIIQSTLGYVISFPSDWMRGNALRKALDFKR